MGTETPWILLRGLGRESRHWGTFPAALAEALGTRCQAFDLPGNGRRWREPSATTVAGQAEALRADLAARGLAGPVNVVALSLGGMVALDWAARHPGEVARLVLINTSAAGSAPFWRRLRWQNYPRLLSFPGRTVAGRERIVLELTLNGRQGAEAVLADWVRWQRERPVSRRNLVRQIRAAIRFELPEPLPPVPTLLLAARSDRLVSWRCSETLSKAGGWPLRVHETAGHDLALEDPAWVIARIQDWMTP